MEVRILCRLQGVALTVRLAHLNWRAAQVLRLSESSNKSFPGKRLISLTLLHSMGSFSNQSVHHARNWGRCR
jgi:hypothetical protein